jgi:hypothetical protein
VSDVCVYPTGIQTTWTAPLLALEKEVSGAPCMHIVCEGLEICTPFTFVCILTVNTHSAFLGPQVIECS